MLTNYLKVALRHLRRHKGYTSLNVMGLAIGLATCLLILLYIRDELSYDRFHENAQRIYLVGLDGVLGGQAQILATSPPPLASALIDQAPNVEATTRVLPAGHVLISRGPDRFYEEAFFWADSTFFDIFTVSFQQGDPHTALAKPNTIILTASTAQRYFGDEDPIGQTLQYNNQDDYTVTAVVEDMPHNAHLRFDLLASMATRTRAGQLAQAGVDWVAHYLYTFVLLREGADASDMLATFSALIQQHVAPQIEQQTGIAFDETVAEGLVWKYYLQPLPDLYLFNKGEKPIGATSDVRYLYLLSAIAAIILFLACINFINLATARSATRAKEVGLRKVLGASRAPLMRQFLAESMLLAVLAAAVAAVLVLALLPAFNALSGKALTLVGDERFAPLGFLAGITLVCGLLAGLYPAFVLSAFRPVAALKGTSSTDARSAWSRRGLVVVQFVASITLLISAGVVFKQLNYMQEARLGFSGEQVVALPIKTRAAQERFEIFRATLLEHIGVVEVAAANQLPGRVNRGGAFRTEGATEGTVLSAMMVSPGFLETMEMKLAAGRAFTREVATEAQEAVIINEAAVRTLGFTNAEDALGGELTQVTPADNPDIRRTIIGIVQDFNFESLHHAIRPLVLYADASSYWNVAVRLRPERLQETMGFLRQQWEMFEPDYPFEYVFVDEDFRRLYHKEARLGQIFAVFTVLALCIACLGLFGLVSFMAEQRKKEIGVRKVLGASVPGIVFLLTKEFMWLVFTAVLVALPVAYLVVERWLRDFAYRTEVGGEVFLLAIGIALTVAFLTISYQSIKAATANPVNSLRYE